MKKKKLQVLNREPLWYKDAIIYELHIKAFMDGDNDGIGDFEGLLSKLDYLEDLGVTCIWLLPFYPSPSKDDGYDISDYYNINPAYGDIKTFKRFLREAHKRNLKVLTELVINHTSDQHEWFQRARRAKPGSIYRDYYVWSDSQSKYKDTRIIFTDYEASNWTWDHEAQAYFWHRFFHHQPDLNYDNPRVQKEIFKIIDYWLDMGVDGFRLDAIPYLFEREGTNCENLPETHQYLKQLRAHVDSKYENVLLLAEANMWPEDSVAYFGQGDECQMNYQFPLMPRLFMAVNMEDRYPIIDIYDQTPSIPENCQWATFLRNHDELTLEMVTDEERDYMYKVYTKDPQARINLGIRKRLAPLLENNRQKIELMNMLLFSLPGTPVLYYGDEIGMGDNYYLGDRDGVRTPMQWDPGRNAGFSDANPQKLYLPLIMDPDYKCENINVENQQRNPNSLLWWMKRILKTRKQYKAFSRGDLNFLAPDNPKILAFIRSYEEEVILTIINLSRFSQPAQLDLSAYLDYIPLEVFSHNEFPKIEKQPYLFTMGPYGYHWFILKKEKKALLQPANPVPLHVLRLSRWESLMDNKSLNELETKVLPNYLSNQPWFRGNEKKIDYVNTVFVEDLHPRCTHTVYMEVEVSYTEGLPEYYFLPMSLALGETEKHVQENFRESILSLVEIRKQSAVLYDAIQNPKFRQYLASETLKKRKTGPEQITSEVLPEYKQLLKDNGSLGTSVSHSYKSRSVIKYDRKFVIKVYRNLDFGSTRNVEISRFLSQSAGFTHVPKYLGSLVHQKKDAPPVTLGIFQEFVPKYETAWSHFADAFERCLEHAASRPLDYQFPMFSLPLSQPQSFEELDYEFQDLLGGAYLEHLRLLGIRTAEMHRALFSKPEDPNFGREEFSLHYQRSLFASWKSSVRTTFQILKKNMPNMPANMQTEVQEFLEQHDLILQELRKIYAKKQNTYKIRVHGNFHLGTTLFNGRDFVFTDFEGDASFTLSERRLKKSPLRDLASMISSIHYVAKKEFASHDRKFDFGQFWADFASGYFILSYKKHLENAALFPDDPEDFNLLLKIFLLEKSIHELGKMAKKNPTSVYVPIRGIQRILKAGI
ncbi:maltose alpha-D-glucosyltransferase [Rapidithrix thailandica]|uniref:maltose alpha-D-glucosyltransferase n=1 Tax=Rapidithrix thailandica TaxID=413964 RepID=A0AAW9S8V2_9BACT